MDRRERRIGYVEGLHEARLLLAEVCGYCPADDWRGEFEERLQSLLTSAAERIKATA